MPSTKLDFQEFLPQVFKFLITLLVGIAPSSSVECLIYTVSCSLYPVLFRI